MFSYKFYNHFRDNEAELVIYEVVVVIIIIIQHITARIRAVAVNKWSWSGLCLMIENREMRNARCAEHCFYSNRISAVNEHSHSDDVTTNFHWVAFGWLAGWLAGAAFLSFWYNWFSLFIGHKYSKVVCREKLSWMYYTKYYAVIACQHRIVEVVVRLHDAHLLRYARLPTMPIAICNEYKRRR